MAPANSDPDLATRVLKLERTVRSIGEVLAAGLALGPASIAYQIADRLGFSGWGGIRGLGSSWFRFLEMVRPRFEAVIIWWAQLALADLGRLKQVAQAK